MQSLVAAASLIDAGVLPEFASSGATSKDVARHSLSGRADLP